MPVPTIRTTTGWDGTPYGGTNSASTLKTVMDALGSKGGQTAVSALGAGLSAYGQAQQLSQNKQLAAQQMRQQADQFAATMAENQLQNDQQRQLTQAEGATAASPLGADQTFAQKQAILGAILKGARNFSVTPGDSAVAAAMGTRSGGLQLPAGGLDPAMIDRLFGDEATQASIAQREKQIGQINPNNPVFDLGALYGKSADGSENAFTTGIRQSNQNALNSQMDESARQRAIIQAAIDDNINSATQAQQKAQGSSWKKKLAKAAIMAGAITATAMTGGAAAPLIGMAAGAGEGAIDGGWKGALMGAGTGALTGGLGSGAASGVKMGLGQALKSTLTNPAVDSQLAGTIVGGNVGNAIGTYGSLAAGKYFPRPAPALTNAQSNTFANNFTPNRNPYKVSFGGK